eukprot:403353563
MEMTKQRTQFADVNMGNQPFGGTIMEVPKPAQKIPPPGLQPYELHLWQEQQQQKHIQSQQSTKQQELFKQQQQLLEIEQMRYYQQMYEAKQKQTASTLKDTQQKKEVKEAQREELKQKQESFEESAFKCLDEIAEKIGTKKSMDELKRRSNNAIAAVKFKNGECNIKFDMNVEDWEQIQEEASQTMPFNVKYIAKHVKSEEIGKVIKEFNVEYKAFLQDTKVFIISDHDYQKLKSKKNKQSKTQKIRIFGQKAENDVVIEIKKLFKKFIKKEHVSDHSIFEGCDDIDAVERTHYYNYLKASKLIDEILKNQGIRETLRYEDSSQNISVKTTFERYRQISDHTRSVFELIQTEKMRLNHYIVVHKTDLPDQQTLKSKVEEKFTVLITDTVIEDSSYFSRYRSDISDKRPRMKYNYVPQDKETHKKKEYEIQVTGIMVDQAIDYIRKKLDDYDSEEPQIPSLKPDELDKLKDQAKALSQKYKVFIIFKKTVTIVGKQSKNRLGNALKEFQKTIQDILKGNEVTTKSMQLADAPNPILTKLMRDETQKIAQIQSQFNVNIKIDKDNYIVSGNDEGIAHAFKELSIIQQKFVSKMVKMQITNPNRIKAIEMKGGVINCEKQYEIQIISLTQQQAKQQEQKMHPGIKDFNQNAVLVENTVHQWSYKVFSADANYKDRHDKVNDWFDYDPHQNSQIEQHYQQCCQSNNFLTPYEIIGDQNQVKNGFTYHVIGKSSNIDTWKQKNTKTGYARQLQRKTFKSMGAKNSYMIAQELYQDYGEEVKGDDIVEQKQYYAKGLKAKVDFFLTDLDKFYNYPYNHSMTLELKKYKKVLNQNILNSMVQIALTKFQCHFAQGYSFERIKIVGFKCHDAGRQFESMLDKALLFEFPQTWQQIDQHILESKDLIIIPLAQGDAEWLKIENQFKVTMPQAKITKIERIQNKKLWRNFKHAVDDIRDKWNKPAQTLMLYHGTRGTAPKSIYDSEEGFNMLFSSGGMWGQAIYFAQNSSYSDGYKYAVSQTTFQMFFARVLVGNYIKLPSDKQIKMPPVDAQGKYYDSIQGHTGGSDVFMIYANKKAYPEYLITYQ